MHTLDGAAWWCRCVFAMTEDAGNAAMPNADKITITFALMLNLIGDRAAASNR
jgi:hypothetical protein